MALLTRFANDGVFTPADHTVGVRYGIETPVYEPYTRPRGVTAWLQDPQAYAVDQERMRNEQALYMFGEYAMFVLTWRIQDHEEGLVARCPTCYVSQGKIAEAYGQASKNKCPDCFGTTFQGGVRARLVRPAIWDDAEPAQREDARGDRIVAAASVQTTADFTLRVGDYIFRPDRTRWQVRQKGAHNLLTGFHHSDQARDMIAYNFSQVNREDENGVAYMIPPTDAEITARLDVIGARYPVDFSSIERINGPVLVKV